MSLYRHILLNCIVSSASICSFIGASPSDLAQPIRFDYQVDDQNNLQQKKKKGKPSKSSGKKESKQTIHVERNRPEQANQVSVIGQIGTNQHPQSVVGQIGGSQNPQSVVGQIGANQNSQHPYSVSPNKEVSVGKPQYSVSPNKGVSVGKPQYCVSPNKGVSVGKPQSQPMPYRGSPSQLGARQPVNAGPQASIISVSDNRGSILSDLLTNQGNSKPRPIVIRTALPKPIIINQRSAICPYVTLTPLAIAKKGNYVELTDGSSWKVRHRDRNKVRKWSSNDAIVIETGQFFSWYSYNLVNYSRGESIDVELFLSNDRFGSTSHWIAEINPFSGYIRLEDGSIWRMSTSELAAWSLNDDVIIGLSQDWFSNQYNYILINPRAKSRFTATFEF